MTRFPQSVEILDDGRVALDFSRLFAEEGNESTKRFFARLCADALFSSQFLEYFAEAMATGTIDDGQCSWVDESILCRARTLIASRMGEIKESLIVNLVASRDTACARANYWHTSLLEVIRCWKDWKNFDELDALIAAPDNSWAKFFQAAEENAEALIAQYEEEAP